MGTGDMNGDGIGDLLWQDSAGDLAIWFMNGCDGLFDNASGHGRSLQRLEHRLGDHRRDSLAQQLRRAGTLAGERLDGASATNLGSVPSNWVVQGMGDFNGDGVADVLWRDTSAGTVAIWFLNSSGGVQSSASVATVPISANWSIVADRRLQRRRHERHAVDRRERQSRHLVYERLDDRLDRRPRQRRNDLDRPIPQRRVTDIRAGGAIGVLPRCPSSPKQTTNPLP